LLRFRDLPDIPDVALLDEDTSVVDGLGETELVDTGLKTALQEILNLEGQDVIELHAGLVEHTDTDETTNEGVTLEETLGVLLVESEKVTILESGFYAFFVPLNILNIPSGTTNLREGEHDAPHLTLVAETKLADELQLSVAKKTMLGTIDMKKRASSCSVAG
jgi:hypothetical protein